jgi:perosamine synthetase
LSEDFSQLHRDWIVNEMDRRGIACGRYFAPIHLQPAYRDLSTPRTDLSVTEFQASRSIALPFFNRIEQRQIDEVCEALCELTHQARELAPATESA